MSDVEALAAVLVREMGEGYKLPNICPDCDVPYPGYGNCVPCGRKRRVLRILEALRKYQQRHPMVESAFALPLLAHSSPVRHALDLIADEYLRAADMHPPFNSAHEGLAVLLEEVREFEAEVFRKGDKRSPEAMQEEIVHVGAMAVRFLIDVCLRGEARK
jgi:hypothetical protein